MALADTIVYSLLKNISQLLVQETSLILNARDQLESLQGELKFINEFLQHSKGKRDKVREVVEQIQAVALEAEDLIDDFVVNMEKHKRRKMLQRLFHDGKKIRLLRHVSIEVKRIKNKIKEILENRDKYNIANNEGAVSRKVAIQSRRRIVEEDDVVSFDKDAELVIKKLDTGDSWRDVVSIVGMGGLGKTTLAKKIYNGSFVRNSFHCRAWVDVSQDYNPRDLLLKIAESVLPSTRIEKLTEEKLVKKLSSGLVEKRYLIVLDDVWDKHLWNRIKAAFPDNGKGSRILISSRVKEVATLASTSNPPYFLPLLNEVDSWKLFSRKVFNNEVCPPKLEELARKHILNKCKGLPLAIIVVAGLLRNRDESMWSKVASGLNWYLAQDPIECQGILALSYEDLPPHLKPCFLYFGVYPEDFEIPVRQLIRLWVAEGFIDQEDECNLDMEDVAEEYLLQLIDRSLIQVASRRTDGGVKSCRIHDLIRDLCISEAKRENFLVLSTKVDTSSVPTKPRRLSINYRRRDIRHDFLAEFSQLRSLLSFPFEDNSNMNELTQKDPFSLLYKFCPSLRVLDFLSSRTCYNIPPKVEKLEQLRYLGLHAQELLEILPPLSKLVNLQTLDLGDSRAATFSANLWEMQQLRHLLISRTRDTSFFIPKGNGNSVLPNLRTLSSVSLHGEDDVDRLQRFPNLKKLKAGCYNQDLGLFESLGKLKCLQTLKIYGAFRLTDQDALVLPLRLTKITLLHTYLDTSAFAKLGGLPNLLVLKLRFKSLVGSSKLEYHSNQGLFPRLEVLHMHDLGYECWSMEGHGLQGLVYLSIMGCSKLKSIPDQLKQLSTLRQLKVERSPALEESLKQIWANDPRCVFT